MIGDFWATSWVCTFNDQKFSNEYRYPKQIEIIIPCSNDWDMNETCTLIDTFESSIFIPISQQCSRNWSYYVLFYWVFLGFTGFHLILLGFTKFYWVLLDFIRFYRVPFLVWLFVPVLLPSISKDHRFFTWFPRVFCSYFGLYRVSTRFYKKKQVFVKVASNIVRKIRLRWNPVKPNKTQ